jgi:HPt (histidine-containing phosphotransfer) domain-containing protein
MVSLFLDEYPKLLLAVREAIAKQDSKALERAAHTLKGSVGNFTELGAFETAQKLEAAGRAGILAGAEEFCRSLELEMELLKPALEVLGKQVTK